MTISRQTGEKQKAGIFPVYFIYGPEEYLIEAETERLLELSLPPRERGLNLHSFRGGEHSGQEIVQAAETVPMFSSYRFVLVKEADRLDKSDVEIVARYLEVPSPSTCFVLSARTVGPWKEYRRLIEKMGKVMECQRLKGGALTAWLTKRIKEKGKTLSGEAAEYFVEVMGDDLQTLDNMLERATLSVAEKMEVDVPDIEGIVSQVKISTVYDLTDAIGQRDLEKALAILEKVRSSRTVVFKKDEGASKMDDPIPVLLSLMARQYRLIWRIKERISRREGLDQIAKDLKMHPWSVKKILDQGRGFTEPSLREGILKCHRTDLAIKRGIGPKDLIMEKLVIDLCRPRAARSALQPAGAGNQRRENSRAERGE